MRRFLWVLAVLAGCKDNSAAASRSAGRGRPAPRSSGSTPISGACEPIASLRRRSASCSAAPPACSTRRSRCRTACRIPCSYEILTPEPEFWTFDVDCRDGMKQRADALFAQYRETSREAIARYAQLDAGGPARRPAMPASPSHPPEPAVEVAVGAKGLDHHGEGLIFIDDDAPCYVRVTGKDAARRLELARLIAKNLTLDNAPMVPRARP